MILCVAGPAAADDSLPPGHMIIQGDIIVPITSPPKRKGVVANAVYRTNTWPDGRVPYELDANLSNEERARIWTAMDRWKDATGRVEFVFKRADDDSYVHIQKHPKLNNSAVGRVSGRQVVNVASFEYGKYFIEHELGHVLGLWHEHSRADRDEFIDIHLDNVKEGEEDNFDILPASPTFGEYDFHSVMHYGSGYFSKCLFNLCKTITVKSDYAHFADVIGKLESLSAGDVAAIRHLYQRRQELSVDLSGDGTGVVTSDPFGILCSTTSSVCDNDFEADERVVLRASPGACATFGGWSGACTGTGSCSVSMTSHRSVTARFDRVANCSGDTYGGTFGAAAPITLDDNLYGENINWDGDEDWFYFFGNEGDSITMKVYAPSGSPLIPQFAIKRSNGSTDEATATYPLSNYAQILNHRLSRTGKFYVKIRGFGQSTGPYVFDKEGVLDHDVGNFGSPRNITGAAGWDEFINFPGDTDYYSFTVSQRASFRWAAFSVDTLGASLFKLQIALYDATGRLVVAGPDNKDLSVRDAYLRHTLSPGDYRLKVRGFGDLVGRYSLDFRFDEAGVCAPPQVFPMSDILVNYGQPLTLVAGVEGSSPLSVEWWTEGTEPALLSSSQELYRPSMSEDASYRAIASNGCGMDSEVVNVRVLTPCDAPQEAILASPANGATGISVTPVLSWQPVPGATNYDVYVDGALYTSTLQTSIVLAERPLGTSVTWRVRTYAYCGTFRDSPTWVFTTETTRCTPPAVVQLLSPPPSATSVIATPTFYWHPVPAATSYELLIDGNAVSS